MNLRYRNAASAACLLSFAACASSTTQARQTTASTTNFPVACASSAGITVPAGFCATVFADSLGRARYLTVAPNGDVYVAIDGSRPTPPGVAATPAFVALRDTNRDGRADVIQRSGEKGNTGIALVNGYLYQDRGEQIVRQARATGQLMPAGQPEVVVTGLPMAPGHRARNFVVAAGGVLYVNVGSPSNSCQEKDRTTASPGKDPCGELTTRAGIWKFSSNALNQQFSPAARFATGIRNATGMAIAGNGKLFAMTHGRDQLTQNWPQVFPDTSYNDRNPAEKLLQVNEGDNFGWPYCYYSVDANRYVNAPEYGGNGTIATRCSGVKQPTATFPAHWSPLDLLFYDGSSYPSRYREGVFVTFHGSWNRSPGMQAGGKVVFQPMSAGVASGPYEIFADGFAGVPPEEIAPNKAKHRPVGLAVAPDGSLYVADDVGGRIYRITYNALR